MAGVTGVDPDRTTNRLTLSNAITLLRLVCVPFVCVAILDRSWPLACLLFWLAVGTDLVDGRLARARGESSRFGGMLDHASDASFVVAGLGALAASGRLTRVLPVVVAVAFVQYVLDSRWLAGQPLRASRLGRWNGVAYFVPVGIVVTREALALAWPGDGFIAVVAWGLVVSTGVSVADRAVTLLGLRWSRDRMTDRPADREPPPHS